MIGRRGARAIGYAWHGGQSSPLYAFASTGRVQSDAHRAGILQELATCLPLNARDACELEALSQYVKAAPVEPEDRPDLSAPIPDRIHFNPLSDEAPEDPQTAIEHAAARAFFASAWADYMEETHGKTFPGREIFDVIPAETDPAAEHAARTLAMDWTRTHRLTMAETLEAVADLARYPDGRLTPEEFGHLAALQAMGTGCGFADRGISLDVPSVEFGAYSLARDYRPDGRTRHVATNREEDEA